MASGENAQKRDIKSMYYEELENALVRMGEKPYRAGQIFSWLHGKLVTNFDAMTNLNKSLRQQLEAAFSLTVLNPVKERISEKDGTRKYLFALSDGNVIESVFMPYRHGNSVCISSQVGCAMGCSFCASTIGGRVRNLAASEMLEQVYRIQSISGERVSNVVVMGSGEPLDNYEQLVRFLRLISDSRGQNISRRNLTVSTCGLAPKIYALADEGLSVTLALSLHAPNDEKRAALMPVAKRYGLKEVLKACRYYYEKTGRRITFEYSLIENVNDGREDAAQLSVLIHGLGAHVNLIPVNPVSGRDQRQPGAGRIRAFKEELEKRGVNVTIRREMGRDIAGACGQLRRSYMKREG